MAEKKNIDVSLIEVNNGQIEGVPANPRAIKKNKFNKLVKSIEENPEMLDLRELLVYPLDGKYIVIGGNMRYEACKKIGYKEIPCKVLDPATPVENLRAYILRDNASYGEWDFDLLANEWEIEEIEMADIDFKFNNADENETKQDEVSDVVVCRAKKGDIWQLGVHRLMCGDSTNEEDVCNLCGGEQIDLLLTDPPYNVAYEGKTSEKLKIENDKMSDENFVQFLTSAFKNAYKVLKKGGAFYIWHAIMNCNSLIVACQNANLQPRQILIWNKNTMVLGRQDYQWKHEPCLYGWKDGAGHYFIDDRTQTTVIDCKKPNRNGEHPTMKPLELMGVSIKNSSRKGEKVLDLFGGSGSTLIACEQLERTCYMMEFDPHYCDVIINRWENLTGQTAIKIN